MKSRRPFTAFFSILILSALLLASTPTQPAYAADFSVSNASELITAINTANTNSLDDVITLIADITLTNDDNNTDGPNGLPIILADSGHSLTIEGGGHTLARSSAGGTPDFRIFYVDTGAELTINQLTIENGQLTNPGEYGGGIDNKGTLTVTGSTFSGNYVGNGPGGGIYNWGTLTVMDSTFSGNSATSGGGINNNSTLTLIVMGSTFFGNSATYGGGFYSSTPSGTCASAAAAIISNSTFSGNSGDTGGGIYNANGVTTLLFNTITANTSGGGLSSFNDGVTCTKAGSNIIAGNMDYDLSAITTTQRFSSLGYNLVGVAGINIDYTQEFNQFGDQTDVTDPMLIPLANNGGPTQTHAILPGSPARNAGDDTICALTPVNGKDQRRVTRPFEAHCDIGAYEFNTGTNTFQSQATYDGWVLESGEFTNQGGSMNNRGKVLEVGDDAFDRQFRAILSFDTAGIPDNAVITRVILKVRRAGLVGANPLKTHNGLVVDIKKAKFYTRPTLQINDFQAKANKNKVGKFRNKLHSGWYRSVLYKGANSYINKVGRTQFRLRFLLDDDDNNVADILKLYSGNAVMIKRPKLIINYYVP